MSRYAYLFEGLTVRRVAWVTLICVVATAIVVVGFTPSMRSRHRHSALLQGVPTRRSRDCDVRARTIL